MTEKFLQGRSVNDNKMTQQELRAIFGLSAVLSLRMLGILMVVPVLSTYGMQLHDASLTMIGIAIGIYGFLQALFQIPVGLISDRISRKPLIVCGLLIFLIGSIIAATTNSIWGLILGRALQGSSAISPAVMALLSDFTREQNRTAAMGFIGVSLGITFAVSLILGPIIAHTLGLHVLFWIIALLAFIGIIIILTIVPVTNSNKATKNKFIDSRFGLTKVLMEARFIKLNAGIMLLHTLLMSSFIALPILMKKSELASDTHWKVYLIIMLLSFIAVVPVMIYAEKHRRMKRVFMSSIAILLLSELLLWLSGGNSWVIIGGMQLFLAAFNVMESILPSWISKESPEDYRGAIMGVYSTSQFIGVAIGGSLGGWLYDIKGEHLIFIFGIWLTVFWFLISSTMKEPTYVSSLKIKVPSLLIKDSSIQYYIEGLPGVVKAKIVPEEMSAYITVDLKYTSREQLEALITLRKTQFELQ